MNVITADTRLQIPPSVYARAFGDEIVLLEFGRGDYFGLDEIGAAVWRGIERGDRLGAIADAIESTYEVRKEDALRDIVELVRDMESRGLVIAV